MLIEIDCWYFSRSYNRIGQLSQGVFIGLSKLEQLELINTSLYRLIEGCFKPLVSLKTLLLAGNYLARQTLSAALFQGLEQLHYLNLDNCRLSSFSEAGIFRYCPRLARLVHFSINSTTSNVNYLIGKG